ncbi:MAG: DUF429 domain-containing protein [Chloroflexota bacterium]|nr:DUF429 domain-containing protein [Chloroflexota bacterium]MDE2960667.1 DUF429 domain-containing protein [Chloroflexota bacterium]
MTTIIGVDFSGHRDDRNTWMASGKLTGDDALLLDSVQPVRREDLYDFLGDIPTPAVAALDFPFGVPRAFAEFLSGGAPPRDMADIWQMVSSLTSAEFVTRRDQFVGQRPDLPLSQREPKRAGDLAYHRESYSPLHTVNPNMLPMTYEGIRMLQRWRQERPDRWHVPPMEPTGSATDRVTLLELMPGALLKSIGLPYKGYKKGRSALERRDQILGRLAEASGVDLPNLDRGRMACRANDDCLDAVVAAVGAAAWARNASRFHHPNSDELADAELEGWIYVPRTAQVGGSA